MKKILLLFGIVISLQNINAQAQIYNSNILIDNNGSPLKISVASNIDGSPYFKTDYCDAIIYLLDGKIYVSTKVKLNLQDYKVIFATQAGEEMFISKPVKKIEFTGCGEHNSKIVFESGFPVIGNQNESTFYQVLDSGKLKLLKFTQISETENKATGLTPGAPTLTYVRAEVYFVLTENGQMIKISKSNDAILNIMVNKKKEVEQYINSNKLKMRKEEDVVKIFNYYNSL